MKKVYVIQNRETGTFIDRFEILDEAVEQLYNYEEENKRDGVYVEDFYEIVEQVEHEDSDKVSIFASYIDDDTKKRVKEALFAGKAVRIGTNVIDAEKATAVIEDGKQYMTSLGAYVVLKDGTGHYYAM